MRRLFFKENIEAKLKAIGVNELAKRLPRFDGEAKEAYFERAASWASDHFGGYSIYHVNGRFRAWKLATHDEANGQTMLLYLSSPVWCDLHRSIPRTRKGGHLASGTVSVGRLPRRK